MTSEVLGGAAGKIRQDRQAWVPKGRRRARSRRGPSNPPDGYGPRLERPEGSHATLVLEEPVKADAAVPEEE